MSASEASERLAQFAAGAGASDVCTPEGRSLLRGAVRAYGAAMAQAGVAWPAAPRRPDEHLRGVDAAVTVAFAAGFLQASDFQSSSRAAVNRIAATYWPQLAGMRGAARLACSQVVELQQAASHMVTEMERAQRLAAQAERSAPKAERLRRQQERLERAQAQLDALAAAVEAEIERARGG